MKKGKFIIAEGADTAGKTTLIRKLENVLPTIYSDKVFIFTREPGNLIDCKFNYSEKLREKLLTDKSLTSVEQAKLFAESRYYHTIDIINELNKGHNIISDRYIFSSLIYQGIELGFDTILDFNKSTLDLLKENNIDIHNIVLQISIETYNMRMASKQKDALEDVSDSEVFNRIQCHNHIDDINNELKNCLGVIHTIDANKSPSDVLIKSLTTIHNLIK